MFELTPFVQRHNLSTFNSFRELENFEREFFGASPFTGFKTDILNGFKTDIKDIGSAYELSADLPGFKKEDINIDLNDNTLTISAERKFEKEEKNNEGNYIHRERSYGSFSRSFDLSGIDPENIKAKYNDGVLTITLPKQDKQLQNNRRLEIE